MKKKLWESNKRWKFWVLPGFVSDPSIVNVFPAPVAPYTKTEQLNPFSVDCTMGFVQISKTSSFVFSSFRTLSKSMFSFFLTRFVISRWVCFAPWKKNSSSSSSGSNIRVELSKALTILFWFCSCNRKFSVFSENNEIQSNLVTNSRLPKGRILTATLMATSDILHSI